MSPLYLVFLSILTTPPLNALRHCHRTIYVIPYYMEASLAEEVMHKQNFLGNCTQEARAENEHTKIKVLNLNTKEIRSCKVSEKCSEDFKTFPSNLSDLTVKAGVNYNLLSFLKEKITEKECMKYSKILFLTNVRCLQLDEYPELSDILLELNAKMLQFTDQYEMPFNILWINYDYLSPVDNRGCNLGHLSKHVHCRLELHTSKASGIMLSENWSVCRTFAHPLPTDRILSTCFMFTGDEAELANNNYYTLFGKPNDKYELKEEQLTLNNRVLGQGAFATVNHATLKRADSSSQPIYSKDDLRVAVKVLHDEVDELARSEFLHEIALMKELGEHQHIVHVIGCITTPSNPMLVMEFCDMGDLLTMLRNPQSTLKDKDLISIAWQIVDGMCYVAEKKIVHRDLAARNILLCKPLTAKISDFGLAIHADQPVQKDSAAAKLPVKWSAIEALNGKFSEKSDVWSMGVLLYEIYSKGSEPYQYLAAEVLLEHLEQGLRLQIPENTQETISNVMSKCWEEHPEDRPDFDHLRVHLTAILDGCQQVYGYIDFGSYDSE